MADAYDLAIIGSGPGGYVCAIRAAQLGMKVAIVERRETYGGTCLNVGCIPSKALLHSSELYEEAGSDFAKMGIKVRPELDLKAMLEHKDETVKANVDGVAYLFKKNKVDTFRGTGRIAAPGKVEVTPDKGKGQTVEAKNIVIATGSTSAPLPGVETDGKRIVTSDEAIALPEVPGKLIVVGAGVIGLELGSVWARLGAKVTVVEYLDRILPGIDGEAAKQFQRMLKKQGLDVRLSSKVTGIDKKGKKLKVAVEPAKGGETETLDADTALVAIGRIPYTEGLGLEDAGIATDERGRIKTNERYATNVDGIWAIGDAIAGPMLAHKAMEEGVVLAETLAGQAGHINYDAIPNVVYTAPEVASVGKTEEALKEAGVDYAVGKFPFTANGRARSMLKTEGFVKFLADKKTDRVLGCHIVGANAGEMIHEAAILIEFGGSAEDLARICHAHPTLSESVHEAALAVANRTLHM